MSARLREGSRSEKKSPASKSKDTDFPKGALLKLACDVAPEKISLFNSDFPSNTKQLPKSLNNSGILSPTNGRKSSRLRGTRNQPHSGEIKPSTSSKVITSQNLKTRSFADSSTIAFGQIYRPESMRGLTISTKKEPADATQTCMEGKQTLDNKHNKTPKTPKKSKMKKNRTPTHSHHRSLSKNEQSFSPKTRNARSHLIRKFLEVKDGCFGGQAWDEIQQAFEPHTKKKTIQKSEMMEILRGISFFGSDGLIDIVFNLFNYSSTESTDGLDHHRFLKVLSSIYKVAHPALEPEDNSMTVVLLQDDASEATSVFKKLSKAVSNLRLEHKPRMIRLMRVKYVQTLDVRQQFWRLEVPVDVTFMFYNPSTALKLRKTFPKMKICLCGNDSDLKDMMKKNKHLPPSKWNLPNNMADDFICAPYLDIEITLASLLGFSAEITHLEWAKQNSLPVSNCNSKVRVSSHSIVDLQQDLLVRIQEGKVRTKKDSRAVPYVYQGDIDMYTAENLQKRKKLFFHPEIAKAISAFWNVLDLTKDSLGRIRVKDFMVMNIKIQKTLMPILRINDAIPSAAKDWESDCNGQFMTENEFFESFFEMADLWCSTVNYDDYVFFLVSLLKSITAKHDSPHGHYLRWRCDEDINHDNYTRTVEQLREGAKGSSVAIPASDSRPALEQGEKVEVIDASGQWRWAKITACHDDGTFDIHVFDDSVGGGQEWDNVAPVHLRPRCLEVRPRGIAIRPQSQIPRWGGDDGVAFIAALAAYDNSEIESKYNRSHRKRRPSGYWEEKDGYESDNSDLDSESKLSDIIEEEAKVTHTLEENHSGNMKAQRQSNATSRFSTKTQKQKIGDADRKSIRNRSVKNRKQAAHLGKKNANKRSKFKSKSKSQIQLDTELSSSNGKIATTRRLRTRLRSGRKKGRKRSQKKAQLFSSSASQNDKITHASRVMEHSHASAYPSDSDNSKLDVISGQKNPHSSAEYSSNNVYNDDMETQGQIGEHAFPNAPGSKSDALPTPRAMVRQSLSKSRSGSLGSMSGSLGSMSGSLGPMTIKERQRATEQLREQQRSGLKIRGQHRDTMYSTQSLESLAAAMTSPSRPLLFKSQSSHVMSNHSPRRSSPRRPSISGSRSLGSLQPRTRPPRRISIYKSSSSPCTTTFSKSERTERRLAMRREMERKRLNSIGIKDDPAAGHTVTRHTVTKRPKVAYATLTTFSSDWKRSKERHH